MLGHSFLHRRDVLVSRSRGDGFCRGGRFDLWSCSGTSFGFFLQALGLQTTAANFTRIVRRATGAGHRQGRLFSCDWRWCRSRFNSGRGSDDFRRGSLGRRFDDRRFYHRRLNDWLSGFRCFYRRCWCFDDRCWSGGFNRGFSGNRDFSHNSGFYRSGRFNLLSFGRSFHLTLEWAQGGVKLRHFNFRHDRTLGGGSLVFHDRGFDDRAFYDRSLHRWRLGCLGRRCFNRLGFDRGCSAFGLTMSIGFCRSADHGFCDSRRYSQACRDFRAVTFAANAFVRGFDSFLSAFAFCAFDHITVGITLTLTTIAATTLATGTTTRTIAFGVLLAVILLFFVVQQCFVFGSDCSLLGT